MMTVMSSQPLSLSLVASWETAVSRLRVAKLTEMNAPSAMMKRTTPTEPKSRPMLSVSTNPVIESCTPYRPFTGERISCWIRSQNESGDVTVSKVPGTGEPSTSTPKRPAGMNSAATQTRTVTIASIVTAPGNSNFFLAGVCADPVSVSVLISSPRRCVHTPERTGLWRRRPSPARRAGRVRWGRGCSRSRRWRRTTASQRSALLYPRP